MFADDGTLMDHVMSRLQWLTDTMVELLRKDGLTVEVPKTKMMVTAAQYQTDEQAAAAQAGFSRDSLIIYGQSVEFLSTFLYLGTMLNSRGNWEAACGTSREDRRAVTFSLIETRK